jgi:hypothetical protein
MRKKYFVAQFNTYYGVVGLADTEEQAIQVAAEKAKRYLDGVGGHDPDTYEAWTVTRVIEYFDPRVTVLEMGSAEFEGEGVTL